MPCIDDWKITALDTQIENTIEFDQNQADFF